MVEIFNSIQDKIHDDICINIEVYGMRNIDLNYNKFHLIK